MAGDGRGNTQAWGLALHGARDPRPQQPERLPIIREAVRATGPTPRAALAFALSKALEQEREP